MFKTGKSHRTGYFVHQVTVDIQHTWDRCSICSTTCASHTLSNNVFPANVVNFKSLNNSVQCINKGFHRCRNNICIGGKSVIKFAPVFDLHMHSAGVITSPGDGLYKEFFKFEFMMHKFFDCIKRGINRSDPVTGLGECLTFIINGYSRYGMGG